MNCEHEYVYQGLVFSLGERLGGSGAHEVIYEDKYYCRKCLAVEYKNKRPYSNSYSKPIAGATPK